MTQTEDSLIKPLHSSLFQAGSTPSMSVNGDLADSESFELVIRPQSGWIKIDWKELVAYRELLWFLVWRDILLRYKQTVLGGAWAILQPLIMMLTFTFIFGRMAKLPSDGFPYPVFVFAGLIPWTLFSQGFARLRAQPCEQSVTVDKGLFSSGHRSYRRGCCISGRRIDLSGALCSHFALLSRHAELDRHLRALAGCVDLARHTGVRPDAVGSHGVLPRFQAHRPVPDTDLDVCLPGVLFSQHDQAANYRWIMSLNPMFGIVTAYRSAILGIDWDFPCLAISTCGCSGRLLLWHALLPQDRATLFRFCVRRDRLVQR